MNAIEKYVGMGLFALCLMATSCDIISGPKKIVPDIPNSGRKVLLEDFTGHRCGNCPRGHEKAAELEAAYGENLIIVSVHAGGFAELKEPTYIEDFRTGMGDELDLTYTPQYPSGFVNRVETDGKRWLSYPDWASAMDVELQRTAEVGLRIDSEYNESTREVSITIDTEFYTDMNDGLDMVVVITEDSVISPQKDYSLIPEDLYDYAHRHVLRGSVTPGTWGTELIATSATTGEKLTSEFNYTLNENWNEHHCSIVAYVLKKATMEVLQVEEAHIKE